MLVVKGAPEDILRLSTHYAVDGLGALTPLDAPAQASIQALYDDLGQMETANLFCRVAPAHKNRILLALKARGHTVGYLGDGVNDAPSLHSADIGISVDSGVDVALSPKR